MRNKTNQPKRILPNSPHGSGRPRTVVYPPEMALDCVWRSVRRLSVLWNTQCPESLIDNEIGLLISRMKVLKISMEHDEVNRERRFLEKLKAELLKEVDSE